MSDMVASTIFELIFETGKLISGPLIFANQFSWPMALLNNDFSFSVSFRCRLKPVLNLKV